MLKSSVTTPVNSNHHSARPQGAFTLVELLVVIAIIGALAGLLLPAVRAARASSKNAACKNNLRQLGIALDLHNGAYGSYPVDGENGFGICAFLLPYLEQNSLYEQLKPRHQGSSDVTVKSDPANTNLEVLICPSFGKKPQPGAGQTNYLGNTHLFSKPTIYDDIRDGESNTMAMGETETGHAWATPGLGGATREAYSSRHTGGANFVFCDASVHFVEEDIDPDVFAALCTIDGKEVIDGW